VVARVLWDHLIVVRHDCPISLTITIQRAACRNYRIRKEPMAWPIR